MSTVLPQFAPPPNPPPPTPPPRPPSPPALPGHAVGNKWFALTQEYVLASSTTAGAADLRCRPLARSIRGDLAHQSHGLIAPSADCPANFDVISCSYVADKATLTNSLHGWQHVPWLQPKCMHPCGLRERHHGVCRVLATSHTTTSSLAPAPTPPPIPTPSHHRHRLLHHRCRRLHCLRIRRPQRHRLHLHHHRHRSCPRRVRPRPTKPSITSFITRLVFRDVDDLSRLRTPTKTCRAARSMPSCSQDSSTITRLVDRHRRHHHRPCQPLGDLVTVTPTTFLLPVGFIRLRVRTRSPQRWPAGTPCIPSDQDHRGLV